MTSPKAALWDYRTVEAVTAERAISQPGDESSDESAQGWLILGDVVIEPRGAHGEPPGLDLLTRHPGEVWIDTTVRACVQRSYRVHESSS